MISERVPGCSSLPAEIVHGPGPLGAGTEMTASPPTLSAGQKRWARARHEPDRRRARRARGGRPVSATRGAAPTRTGATRAPDCDLRGAAPSTQPARDARQAFEIVPRYSGILAAPRAVTEAVMYGRVVLALGIAGSLL